MRERDEEMKWRNVILSLDMTREKSQTRLLRVEMHVVLPTRRRRPRRRPSRAPYLFLPLSSASQLILFI